MRHSKGTLKWDFKSKILNGYIKNDTLKGDTNMRH